MIIGISGKINSGKDLTGKIIQILTSFPLMSTERVLEHIDKDLANNKFEIRKFADKLKDIVCILIGCTREQLEDREFKEKELGEEWWYYGFGEQKLNAAVKLDYLKHVENTTTNGNDINKNYITKLTPRLLLQLIGTECMRNIIHPNTWVNALMYKYKDTPSLNNYDNKSSYSYPNWVITDMRFPNELHAIKQRGGLTIRIERESEIIATHQAFMQDNKGEYIKSVSIECHLSETALDDVEFDCVIRNNGSIETLIDRIRVILLVNDVI